MRSFIRNHPFRTMGIAILLPLAILSSLGIFSVNASANTTAAILGFGVMLVIIAAGSLGLVLFVIMAAHDWWLELFGDPKTANFFIGPSVHPADWNQQMVAAPAFDEWERRYGRPPTSQEAAQIAATLPPTRPARQKPNPTTGQ